jgi:hypothetical protein
MAEQHLDDADVGACLKEMGGKAVAQGVDGGACSSSATALFTVSNIKCLALCATRESGSQRERPDT